MTQALPNIQRLIEIMARLRDPEGGCPWDIEQTFETIAPYTIEEAYEVADAIQRGDTADLRDELGDLLLQVVFHARMAEEAGLFAFEDVAGAISDKMVRRHPHVFGPHVFGDETVETEAAQRIAWEDVKAAERAEKAGGEPESVLDDVPLALPALLRAEKLQKRASRIGFDWAEAAPILAKIEEEIAELRYEMETGGGKHRLEDELGDILFVAVNLARHLRLDPESALRGTNAKFERRFRRIEALCRESGRDPGAMTLDELDALWDRAKEEERAAEASD
ncbi:MAG: nucleoside triphosphate pyrophosphohydrolase [Rhodospirillaceae bacterium]|jgi:nucleoside triphosphate diphosphatase|nr:nucleoside triphosphate pyrophosphohydrolase [Rhodospirillaceae bacterium]MBT6119280.1 nucleoside triphosphate pyrophosphohydrolase [Rhodospirillaceae bacterium]